MDFNIIKRTDKMLTITTKKTILFLVFCTAILSITLFGALQASPNPEIPTEQEAKTFVEDLIKQGMEVANKSNTKQDEFGALLEKNFVTKEIANFVLGAGGRTFADDQKARFHQLYKKRLVQMYSTPERVKTFRNTTHKIEAGGTIQSDKTLLIKTLFFFNDNQNSQPAKVSWKIVKKDDQLKIFDIEFEGVSQLLAHRSEYKALLNEHGNNPEKFLTYLEKEVESKKNKTN